MKTLNIFPTLFFDHEKGLDQIKQLFVMEKSISIHHLRGNEFGRSLLCSLSGDELEEYTFLTPILNRFHYRILILKDNTPSNISKAYQLGFNQVYPLEGLSQIKGRIQNEFKLFHCFEDFISKSRFPLLTEKAKKSLNSLPLLIHERIPILLLGPTGVGKTTLVKSLHQSFYGEKLPLVEINCSEFNENMLESEFFGFKKGSFTGAHSDKKGRIKLADKGILFLDEVDSMPMSLQRKLLKVIEEKEFYPIGSEQKVHSDFHLVCASSSNLLEKVKKGSFRKDLYYRISSKVFTFNSLRESPQIIREITNNLFNSSPKQVVLEDGVISDLMAFPWSGNIRELKSFVKNLILESGLIKRVHVQSLLEEQFLPVDFSITPHSNHSKIFEIGFKRYMEKVEEELLISFQGCKKGKLTSLLNDIQMSTKKYYTIKKRLEEKGA